MILLGDGKLAQVNGCKAEAAVKLIFHIFDVYVGTECIMAVVSTPLFTGGVPYWRDKGAECKSAY